MSKEQRIDPFDALDDADFDTHVARLLDKPVPSVNVSIRMSTLLLKRLKREARRADLPYQTFTKRLLEIALDRLERTDSLRVIAPQDLAEASKWLETDRQRLLTWSAAALAVRLNGRVVGSQVKGPVEAVIEFSAAGRNGRKAGIALAKKADDVTLGTFQNAFISLGCERGYIIGFASPKPAQRNLAKTHSIYYEGIQELLSLVPSRRAS